MNRALRPTTDEERAEQIAHDKIILFREGWPDMHQEPDWMEGEAQPGTMLGLVILFTIVGIWAFALGWMVSAWVF